MVTIKAEKRNNTILQALRQSPEVVTREIAITFEQIGNLLKKFAKDNHRWTTRTGNLEKDIGFSNFKYYIYFGLGYNIAMTNIGNGLSYGTLLHNGRRGWSADPWIKQAVFFNETKINELLNKGIDIALKKAGVK